MPKTDPTGLAGLRRRFRSAVRKRVVELKYQIALTVAKEDAFGLGDTTGGGLDGSVSSIGRGVWSGLSDAGKLERFQEWWEELAEKEFWDAEWYQPFIDEAYQKGLERSFGEKNRRLKQDEDQYGWRLSTFLQGILSGKGFTTNAARLTPQVRDVSGKFISERALTIGTQFKQDLKGISIAAAQRMGRVLAQALEERWSPTRLARGLAKVVDTISWNRAKAIAQTELTTAFAEAQLDALEELGETEVGQRAEWSTFDEPCPQCEPMDGVVMTIEEARGLIPRHINCLCSWELIELTQRRLPGQKRTKKEKAAAVKESKEAGDGSWGLTDNQKSQIDPLVLAFAKLLRDN